MYRYLSFNQDLSRHMLNSATCFKRLGGVYVLHCICIHWCRCLFCNEQPSQATANPVGEKACSSTKGGLLRIPNTYSIHKVSSLKFAYFQGRLPRHITSPSEKTRPESWPGDYMGKATPFWQLSSSHRCHQM